jgi:hypothetical protein
MTDSNNEPGGGGRADLRALQPSDAQADRVIGAVMSRLGTRPQRVAPTRPDALEIVGRFLPPAWIAAAAVLLTAASLTVVARRQPEATSAEATSIEGTVATWAAEEHVPTNAELLAAFQGYQR